MAGSDLERPLGLGPKTGPRRRRLYLGAACIIALIAAGGLAWRFVAVPRGPTATAVINAPPKAISPDQTGAIRAPQPATLTEVAPSGSLTDVGQVVIHNPSDPLPLALAALPEQDLVEASPGGPLPKVSAAGRRPLDAYARPSQTDPQQPRVAIVIGGLGVDPASTRDALAALPGEVTLAFAPYDQTMPADVAAARSVGHELMLQLPLEPFNYPQTNPGPNTLTVDATADENSNRLHWLLGRMTNYIGVENYLGARFTAEGAAMTPVMQEIARRGLLYLDDGSSARSVAASLAGTAPFLRADLVLDADLSADAIDAQLTQLQTIARQRGYAVATGTAFPVTVDRVAAFVKAAASKGIAVVPLSAIVTTRS
jgi:polysaccharide deacetylase 2 family uncharacterized protein YibQ